MKPHLLYVIGVPGAGKTSLMRELVLGRRRRVVHAPFAHTIYEDGLVQLGRDRGTFGGTDALGMSVQPKVVAALQAGVWPRVIAEGDRLANASFFTEVKAAGYELDVLLLTLPVEVASERRNRRGTNQDERWVRGRETKVHNLQPYVTRTLDATLSPQELAAELADHFAVRGS